MASQSVPNLDTFLTALRFEGAISVGPHEIVRLQHVFRQSPPLNRDELRDLLACTLVKHQEQRSRFDALFDDWYDLTASAILPSEPDEELASAEEPPTVPPSSQPPKPEPLPKPASSTVTKIPKTQPKTPEKVKPNIPSWRIWAFVGLMILSVVMGYGLWRPTPPAPTDDPEPEAASSMPLPRQAMAFPSDPVDRYWTWVPEFKVPRAPLVDPATLALTVAVLSLCGGVFLVWRYRRRNDIPDFEPAPQPGPAWLPLRDLDALNPELLSRDDLREVVWRVEHFVSEDLTEALDIGHTVTATAQAGGLPELHFQHAVYAREVWLWRDAMVQDAAVTRLLDDIERSLTRAGLPVRTGVFVDTPDTVRWQEGQEFSPLVLEGHRQHALVVIVTDGYGLRLAGESALAHRISDTLLRAFSAWPRLVFVDASGGEYALAALVQPYGLTCIAPEDIPAFLGAGPLQPITERQADSALLGDLRVWAAATALSTEPVSDETAFALRDHLELSLSPWGWREIMHAAEGFGGMVDWSAERRAELLNWLTRCYCYDGAVEPGSPLDKALDYWLERYREEGDARQSHESGLLPWQQTEAQHRRDLDIAFLDLWRAPERAVKILYRLNQNFANDIRERLSGLATWDTPQTDRSDVIVMPWRLSDLLDPTRWMLAQLKFEHGQPHDPGPLKTSRALGLACGLCGGITVMALVLLVSAWMSHDAPAIKPDLPEPVARILIQETYRVGAGTYELVIGTPKALRVATIPADTTVDVTWRWAGRDNVVSHGQSELWHAGSLAQPIRACADDWPRRSLVVIEASPKAKPVRQLAIRLLDRGSADRVLIGEDWRQQLHHLIGDDGRHRAGDQLVTVQPLDAQPPDTAFQGNWAVVRSDDFLDLARQIDFPGAKALGEVWKVTQAEGPVQLWGGPNRERDGETGMWLVEVCGGTFTMGSNYLPPKKEDERFYINEKPKHPVTISTFRISETEVTRKQFGRAGADDGQLPAGNLTWNEAREFCEANKLTLPTEAEWEYAARGGSTTEWSFGDDEAQLDKFAWFGEGIKAIVHPVREKLPNPLGLYDMHGNVLEWVEDCYDSNIYKKRASAQFVVDPQNDKSCSRRVLRGGWSVGGPELLRSAGRDGVGPERADVLVGFRSVRRPRRQP